MRSRLRVDAIGLLEFIGAIVSLMYGMTLIADDPAQARNPLVWGLFSASAVLAVAFVLHLRRALATNPRYRVACATEQEVTDTVAQETQQHPVSSDRHREAIIRARTAPREHVPHLVTGHEVREHLHGSGPMGRFNNTLAVAITRGVGTMWAAYVFVLIAVVSFPQALIAFLNGDALVGVNWLSQSFLQLVLLPILLVGQRVISDAQDRRAEVDHETLTALHTINVQQLQILEALDAMSRQRADN